MAKREMQKELEKLKGARNVAHTKFRRKESTLQDQINNGGTIEILKTCLEDMNKSYEQLEDKHENYMQKLYLYKGLDAEIDVEEEFMNNIDSSKIKITTAYNAKQPKLDISQDSASVKPKIKV